MMKTNILESYSITALTIILGSLAAAPPAKSQPITPANDGTGTTVNQNSNQFNIQGGTQSGANLFHSFDKFNVPTNQTANFLTTPDTQNILGRVTGGNASYINGLIQVLGSNSNLFLMNPAGIMFGPNASLNIPASFSVTTATGIGFDNNNYWFKAMGTNDYSNLVGNPSGYRFNVSNPGAIVNEGNLSLNPGENLTLLGGTVINTGELSTAGGNITVAAVEGGSVLRISQPGYLLSLEVETLDATSLQNGENISITPLSLARLLTGGEIAQATSVIVNANGEIVLTDSNTLVANTPGDAIVSGSINVSIPPNPPYEGGDMNSIPLFNKDGRAIESSSPFNKGGQGGSNTGGQVNVLGSRVALLNSNINADGLNGGGTVLIGGDFQGNGIVPNSQQTFVNNNSFISADTITNGDGGRVIIWSDGITDFAGNISAKGGENSGDGGFVEVSGKEELIFNGNVDVSAAFGNPGTILLDPENVTVGDETSDSETLKDNSEVSATENTDSQTTENSDNSEPTETETPIDPFAQDENADVTISAENLGELSGDVILLADNDITINEKIETDSSVELKAGRSININADIDTSVGNGNIDLFGNNDEMNLANRSNGKASINQLDGTTLNAGSGTINIQLGNLGEVGDINLASLTTTGEVLVNANGGNIARVSSNSLINAGSVLFQTSGDGGIGLIDAPLQLNVENLEAVSGSGGIFFDVGNVNIGGVSEEVDGIVTAGGDIDIKSDGNVTLTETISTIETVENNSEISSTENVENSEIVENNSEISSTENTEIADNNDVGGSINIEATGDIIATGSGIKGGGESVSLSATNIKINDEFDETSGDADVKLEATNDITVEDIEDDVLEFQPGGGEIEFRADVDGDGVGIVEMLDNEADDGSDQNTFENGADTIKTNGRDLTIAGAGIILGNIDTSWLPVFSGDELLEAIDVEEGGAIPAEGTKGTATFTFIVDGDLGTIENLDVRFSATHTWNEDLEVYLKSPEGKEVKLFGGVGGMEDNFQDTVLDHDASTSIKDGNAPFDGTYSPEGSLAKFNGENPNGRWTLRVEDTDDPDSGRLYRAGDNAPWGTAIGTQLLLRTPLVQSGGGNGGAINIEATHGNLRVGNIHSLSETGNGGRVDLKANNNIITGLINSSSNQGIGGNINLNALSGNIDTFSLDTSSIDGDGGNVTITAQGGISTTEVNASVENGDGNGGEISLIAEGDISTQSLNSSVVQGNGDGGEISLTAGGDISTQSLNSSVVQGNGNGGEISLTAGGDISTQSLNSSVGNGDEFNSSVIKGDGGEISLTAGGDISTQSLNSSVGNEDEVNFSVVEGDGGNITLTAEGGISTEKLESNVEHEDGNGGNISLKAGGGNISTTDVNASVKEGDGGDITLAAISGDISTKMINSYLEDGDGKGGDITLSSEGNISTKMINSYLEDGDGDGGEISLTAGGNIFTERVQSNVLGQGDGGDITFTAGGNIETTNKVDATVEEGDGGNITLTAEGDITITAEDITELVDSSVNPGANSGNGGVISVSAGGNITITESLKSSSGANSGDGGDISVSAGGNITTGALNSSSSSEGNSGNGGDISVSAGGNITTEAVDSSSLFVSFDSEGNSGNGGDISVSAGDNITTGALDSFSYSKKGISGNGGDISVSAGDNITTGALDSFSYAEEGNSGNGGAISLLAEGIEFINPPEQEEVEEVEKLGIRTFSLGTNDSGDGGDINIITNNLSNIEILTISSSQKSGEVSINSQQEGDLILNDLSIITSQQVRVEIPLLDIIEIGVGESGQSGNVSINSSGNINLNNITIESDTKGDERAGDVTITSLGTISLDDSQLKAITSDDGDAGDITIKTPQDIQLTNESQLQADTEGKGNAGNIEIQAQTLELNQSTSLTTETSGAGKPGTIIIQAKTIDIGENAQISATVTADSTNEEGGGNINIFANSLNISGSLGIFAETAGAADAGTLTLNPYRGVGEQLNAFDPDLNITFTENGFISARTTSTGQGGNINIFAPENIDIAGYGKISVETTGTGNAGEIKIEAQNLTLTEGIAISAETNSAGAAGTIEINSPTVTIGNDASISATALEGATNTAAGGNITINSSDLNISGRLGIFAETAGESPAGTLTLNPYRGVGEQGSRGVGEQLGEFDPNLNITFTENGFISARTKATGDGGNINIFAPENINITGEGRITVETTSTGNSGTINIDTQNLTIAENTTISASTSDSGEGGTININPTQTFELEGQIITETTGTGNGGNIFINTGEMTAPNSTISAKSTETGNAGDIEITAQENITTGIITSEANNTTETPNGGNISITSEQGQINATQAIQSFSNRGNAGDVTLQAKTDITTDTINSHGQTQGGQITITSETGNIDTSAGTLANYSGGGNGGKVTIEAPSGNITTNNIYTFADADGGEISLKAGGNINLTDNTNIISASEPPEKERGSGRVGKGGVGERGSRGDGEIGRGKGGDIILEAGNNINTTTARIYSGADDGDTGNINIIADGAIEIGQIDLASGFIRERLEFNNNFTLIPVPKGEATQGTAGNIIISSKNSTIDTSADRINSRSPDGSGDIIIEATGNITTGKLEASALNQEKPTTGGNIEIISRQGEINATKPIETFSERGEGGSVALNAEGHIHTGSIRSEGMQKGGDIEIESRSQNSIEIIGNISSYSTEGTAGNITLRSPGDINLQGIRSDGMQQGGRIKVESETGNIDATGGEIDSFSDQGTGGNVEINASESVNLGNVSSFGMTESGNLTIQSQTAQVNTGNVTTQAPAGSSGNIIINAEEVGTGNLSSIGTTSAGEINVAATDGSIQTYAIEISSDGSIGSLRLQATEDIATEDIDQNAGAGDANIEINSGGDQTTGGINQTADGDTNNTQNAGGNISGDVNQNAGNNANNNQTAGGNISGDVNQNAGNNANNNQTAGGNISGDVNQNAGNNANNNQTAGGNIIGDINQNAGNNANNNQTAGGNIIGDVNQNAGNNANNNQTAGGQQTIGNVTQTAGNNAINIQTAGGQQNIGEINQTFGNESINIQRPRVNQNTDNTSVNSNNNNSININPVINQTNSQNNSTNNTTTNSQETNTFSTTTTSEIISTATPSNNNQTANTTTAQSQTESSINNTTDTQQILKIIDTPNTNPLTVATSSDQVITILEQTRSNEYSNYLGVDLQSQFLRTKNVREILTDMAAQTGKESAVVYINTYPDQLQIILYTKDGQPIIKTIPAAKYKAIKKNALTLRAHIINPSRRHTDSYLPSAQQLYDWLIAPISAELEAANIDTLLFSMDEGLRTLPLAVLHDGSQFLIEKYSISLIPSVSLMDTNYRSLEDTKVLAMGASEFTSQSPLPAVPVELDIISEKLWQGRQFLNEDFTRNNLLNERKNYPYPIIHLATHAEFLPGVASTSYIQLWGDEQIKLDQIREFGWNEPAVELLVLSACRTAFGDKNAELGFAGLAVAAGVKSALASIWYVSDEGTLGLMTEFYTHLNNAKIKAEALRQAQLAMLRGKVVITKGELRGSGTRRAVVLPSVLANIQYDNLSHPYYWAGFTLVGSPW